MKVDNPRLGSWKNIHDFAGGNWKLRSVKLRLDSRSSKKKKKNNEKTSRARSFYEMHYTEIHNKVKLNRDLVFTSKNNSSKSRIFYSNTVELISKQNWSGRAKKRQEHGRFNDDNLLVKGVHLGGSDALERESANLFGRFFRKTQIFE